MPTIFVIVIIAAVAALVLGIIVARLIYICPPSEVLIFAGTHRRVGDRMVGYRLVQGGRGIRIPMLETVDRMDLTNMIIDLRVMGAYSKGGIPLNVEGVANVKVASSEPALSNAIERFLGRSRQEIMAVARETLEGNLRGVLSTLTPEEVNQDRLKFAESLLHEADNDLGQLGLSLDTLKIQNVSDDKGYLDSLGRRQSAELLMRSRIAEAENQALSAERSAANLENQEIAKVNAEIATVHADAQRRIVDAQTKKDAMVAEQQAVVYGAVAKATADVDVQRARVEQVKLQLVADRVKPAEARRQELIEQARGQSSKIIQEGRSTAAAIRKIGETWAHSGESARQIFVAQKLTTLVKSLMSTVSQMPIDKVTVIDKSLSSGGRSNLAVDAAVASEQIKHTLGVDVPALLNRIGGVATGANATPGRTTPPQPPTR